MAFPNENRVTGGKDGADISYDQSSLDYLFGTTFALKLYNQYQDQAWLNVAYSGFVMSYALTGSNSKHGFYTLREIHNCIVDRTLFPNDSSIVNGKDGADILFTQEALDVHFFTTLSLYPITAEQTYAWHTYQFQYYLVFVYTIGSGVGGGVKTAIMYANIDGVIKQLTGYMNIGGTVKQALTVSINPSGGVVGNRRGFLSPREIVRDVIIDHAIFPNHNPVLNGKDGQSQ